MMIKYQKYIAAPGLSYRYFLGAGFRDVSYKFPDPYRLCRIIL